MESIVVGNARFIAQIKKIGVGVDQKQKEIALIIILQEESIQIMTNGSGNIPNR